MKQKKEKTRQKNEKGKERKEKKRQKKQENTLSRRVKARKKLVFFFFSIFWRMGQNNAFAHHTSTYFYTRRVSI